MIARCAKVRVRTEVVQHHNQMTHPAESAALLGDAVLGYMLRLDCAAGLGPQAAVFHFRKLDECDQQNVHEFASGAVGCK